VAALPRPGGHAPLGWLIVMDDSPAVALVRQGYEAFAARDVPTLVELLDENVVWHNPGNNLLSGEFSGRDEVLSMFARNLQLTQGTGSFQIHDVLASDRHVVSLLQARVSRPDAGKHLDVKEMHVFHISRGKIREVWVFSEDQRLNDQFWS